MLVFEKTPDCNFAAPESTVDSGMNRIAFTPSPHHGLATIWFRVKIRNTGGETQPKTKVILKNTQSMLGDGSGLFHPVLRTDFQDWRRLPAGERIVLPDGRTNLEWILDTPATDHWFEMAFSYPYDLDNLNILLKETGSFWRQDEIGVTGEERTITRLSNCYGSPDHPVPGVFLLARQHAGEISGSWVLDGILRELARRQVTFPVWCVPFVDLDGVCKGDYGKDSFPQDMNRSWGPNAIMRHEIKEIAADMQRWQQRVLLNQSLVMDFHSPGAEESGIYTWVTPDVDKLHPDWGVHAFLDKLEQALHPYASNPFALEFGYKRYSAWGSFDCLDDYCLSALPVPFASFETSYFRAGDKILERQDFQHIGAIFAEQIIRFINSSSSADTLLPETP